MTVTHLALSTDPKRNQQYAVFLRSAAEGKATIAAVIRLGAKLMRKAKLHHHFFRDYTWETQAKALVDFGLKPLDRDSTDPNALIDEKTAVLILSLFEKRITERIPVEYITHEAGYLGRSFYVNEHVLVPRSIMHTRFEDFLKGITWKNYKVLDLCTGSGCIGITLALMDPHISVDLADISPQALAVAEINIKKYWLNDRVKCIQSDLFENIHDKYDLIITNPPYVSSKEYQKSPQEFKTEPRIALEAGEDGLSLIHHILTQSKIYLNPEGTLIAEVGCSAAKRIKKQYPHVKLQWFKYRPPGGKASFFADEGVFLCHANALPEKI